jgi:hypothetical protein
MTADQFQRDVIDILGLFGKSREQKIDFVKKCIAKAKSPWDAETALIWMAIGNAAYANAEGYSLETIFQMALDRLEKEHGR